MILIETAGVLFGQVQEVINAVTPEQYVNKSRLLNEGTLGQHVRHVIELFTELLKGYENGIVDYDNRERSYIIETSPAEASRKLDEILKNMGKPDKQLLLYTDYSLQNKEPLGVPTNYQREVIYNIEHTIHHMALMRIALEKEYQLSLPDSFGVAPSTLKYRQACAQ